MQSDFSHATAAFKIQKLAVFGALLAVFGGMPLSLMRTPINRLISEKWPRLSTDSPDLASCRTSTSSWPQADSALIGLVLLAKWDDAESRCNMP